MDALRRVLRKRERERKGRREEGFFVVIRLVKDDGCLGEFDGLIICSLDGAEVHRP